MARYSGPALAAGAISRAIGDIFEGMLAGQRGGIAAEKAMGEMGIAEREMGLKTAAFPHEAALARAQTGLLGQQQARTSAEAERIYRMTPEEIGQMRAETERARGQTGLLGSQTQSLDLERGLQFQAIDDWDKVRATAHAAGRPVTAEDQMSFLRRHPVLMSGAQKIPASALLDMNQMEAWLKYLAAQKAGGLDASKFLLDARKQAFSEAGAITEQIYGKESGKPQAADAQAWLAAAFRNRVLVETQGPAAQQSLIPPGQAPKDVVDYVFKQLKSQHSGEEHSTLRAWTYEIISLLGMGAVSWQAAFEGLRKMNEPAGQPQAPSPGPVNVPPRGAAPGAGAPAPTAPRSGAVEPAPPGGGPGYRYNPATGEFR